MTDLLCSSVVGRATELAALSAALDSAWDGAGRTVVVTGEAGIGKSRLLREVRGWCGERGGVALVGRAVDSSRPAPFRPLAEALMAAYRAGARPRDPDVLPYRAALGCLVPDAEQGPADPTEVSLLHVAEGFLRVTRSLGRQFGGVAVLLDDLHWTGEDTVDVIEYLADNIASEPVLLVLSARADAGPVRRLTALADRRVATAVHLRKLRPEQTVDMARRCLGGAVLPARVAELISTRAEGLPFFVEELLAAMRMDGGLRRQGDRWVEGRLGSARPPVTFADSVAVRCAALSPSAREVLFAAALLGRRIRPDLVAELAALDRAGVDSALLDAQRLALLDHDESGFQFRHALTRDALLEALPGARSERARRALDALREARPEPDDDLREVMADLAEMAGDAPAAASLLVGFGRQALARGALTSAESAFRRAARLSADSPAGLGTAGIEVVEGLVETLALAGHTDEVVAEGEALLVAIAEQAPSVDPDGRRRGDVHLAMASAAVAGTDWALAAEHLERAEEVMAHRVEPGRTARIDTLRAVVALGEGRLDDAEKLAAVAVRSAEHTGAPDLRCEALLVHGRCVRGRSLEDAERSLDAARSVALDAGLAHREARALAELGFVDAWRHGESTRLLQARDLAAVVGAPETEAVAENALAALAWFRADTAALASHAAAALALSRRFRLGVMVPSAMVMLAGAHAMLGEAGPMAAMLDEAAPLIEDEPTQLIARHAHCYAVEALTRDDLVTARAEFAAAAAVVRDRPAAVIPPLTGMYVLFETVHGGDAATLAAVLGQTADSGVPLMASMIVAAQAVEHGRAGDPEGAGIRMSQALAELGINPFVRAVTQRIVAPLAVADGWGDPAGWLTDALATFEARRLPAPARACRTALRDIGVASADPRAAGRSLTRREREVLALVAEGLPNKVIAERLFLSPRTVEKHVERLLAKSGTSNRAQLVGYSLRPDSA